MLIGLIGSIAGANFVWSRAVTNDWSAFDRQVATVVRIETGDLVQVILPTGSTRVHLLGIFAHESGPRAAAATAYAMKRLLNKHVILRLEPTQTRDTAGNLLAYVYLSDSEDFNLDAVRDGRDYADRRSPHTFANAFDAAENDARKKLRGLWAGLNDADEPAWRQAWLAEYRAQHQDKRQEQTVKAGSSRAE